MIDLGSIGAVVAETVRQWREEDITRLAASLAYFAACSLLPLVLLIAAVAGLIFGEQAVELGVVSSLRESMGPQVAEVARNLLQTFYATGSANILTTAVSAIALLLAATGLFRHLKNALNVIWNVPPTTRNKMKGFLRDTVLSLVTVIGLGLGLLLVLLVNVVLFGVLRSLDQVAPELDFIELWQAVGHLMLFFSTLLMFAVLFKVLPDARIAWRDLWVGAGVTAFLFTLTQLLLVWFLSQNSLDTLYGASSAFMLILIWVYFSSHVILLGAEFTQVFANHYGAKIEPQSLDVP